MNKVCLIIPYFGKFPNYFYFWYKTALSNNKIDFLIFSDESVPDFFVPNSNVIFRKMSFSDLKYKINKKLKLKTGKIKPYKLCDFKPFYGIIFEEFIKNYSYWGYGDLDVLYGNLNKFLDPIFSQNYEKIFRLGHLSFVKNTEKMNNLAFENIRKGSIPYPWAQRIKINCIFDEDYYNKLLIIKQINVFDNRDLFSDIDYNYVDFFEAGSPNKNRSIFHWKNGCLKKIDCKNKTENEIIYVHFQKRRIDCVSFDSPFYLLPNKIVPENYDLSNLPLISYKKRKYKLKLIFRIKRKIIYTFFKIFNADK